MNLHPDAYPSMEAIYNKGDEVNTMFLIERGSVFIHAEDLSRQVIQSRRSIFEDTQTFLPQLETDRELTAGGCFGDEIIIDHFASPVWITCVTDVDVLTLSKEDLWQILEKLPATKKSLKALANRRHWEKFKEKIKVGGDVDQYDPEEGVEAEVAEIISLNKELKQLQDKFLQLKEEFIVREELLKVVKTENQ